MSDHADQFRSALNVGKRTPYIRSNALLRRAAGGFVTLKDSMKTEQNDAKEELSAESMSVVLDSLKITLLEDANVDPLDGVSLKSMKKLMTRIEKRLERYPIGWSECAN